MIRDITELFKKTNRFGFENTELLIQERINGEEYIVNTVSCEGIPRVTTVWKYNKIKTSEGARYMIHAKPLMNWALVKQK